MVEEEREEEERESAMDTKSTEDWLRYAEELVPIAIKKATMVKVFLGKWKLISSKLEQVPQCLSSLSSHPCFCKNSLCKEQLQAVSATLQEAIDLADSCLEEKYTGKLQMQSNLDSLHTKLDLNLHDCGLLVKTGVLGEATLPSTVTRSGAAARLEAMKWNIRELLARLQIGRIEAKHKALDNLLEAMKDDEKNVLSVLGRSNISAIVQLLGSGSHRMREKAAMVVCYLAESGSCESLLVPEGAIPPLIRLLESGSPIGKEKAVITLQRLSMASETARLIVGHGGIPPLIEICRNGVSVTQAAGAGTLKNLSAVPEIRQNLAGEGVIKIMLTLLDSGILLGSKEYAAECLQNLTASNESLRRSLVAEGGIQQLLRYLDGPLPQESGVGALRNLVGSVAIEALLSLGLLPRLVHVLKAGSLGAQQAAASVVSRVCNSREMRKLVGESGILPLLVKMLEAKTNSAREVAAQALSNLLVCPQNCREMRKSEKGVPSLVQLLDPGPQNSAKKYAVSCLGYLSSSKKCRKLMVSYGAIGYLKKLCEMEVPGAKKLLERLERGKLRSIFSKR
ncbi:hypothetical protein AMTRI_Chr09g42840 [Amborella trichopoda]